MTQTQVTRSRTFEWPDPTVIAGVFGSRSGLELMQAMIDGELPPPPVLNMLGVDAVEAEHGRVSVYLTPQEFHYNPLGTVHGGVLATLLDTAAGCAVQSTLPHGSATRRST
jgi:acyl-coenzyme A thioesterase PaaI-like protein